MDIDIKWGRKGGIVIAVLVGRISGDNARLFERMAPRTRQQVAGEDHG